MSSSSSRLVAASTRTSDSTGSGFTATVGAEPVASPAAAISRLWRAAPTPRIATTASSSPERLRADVTTVAPSAAGTVTFLDNGIPITGGAKGAREGTLSITVSGDKAAFDRAKPLLDHLYRHASRPEFTCRFRWSAGAFALWDNRLCVHQAFNDYDGFRRELYRTTIAGEVPK